MDFVNAPPGCRSADEYWFSDEQADDILRTVAYHRIDYDRAMLSFPPVDDQLRLLISTSFRRPSAHGLGILDRLPTELLWAVIFRLDMRSVFRLRQVNTRARQTLEALIEYRAVAFWGLDAFCALLRTGLAERVSLTQFWDALCTKNCTLCGEFGGFISLPTWTRCCIWCVHWAPETQLRSLASIRRQLRLPGRLLNSLPQIKTLPGLYCVSQNKYVAQVRIVPMLQATALSAQRPPPQGQARPQWVERHTDRKYNFMGSCALPYYDIERGRAGGVEFGVSCAGCQFTHIHTDPRGGDWLWTLLARDMVYSQAGFLEHFKWCAMAQYLWGMSEEGTVVPAQLPFLARTGSIFMV
ncbi:uncharacterized protein B0T15DRAFT_427861 [Chaetomium strumarium]|uniref:F-box domain-containing protein n=1 Tax=Chaetomium strumarium TaxID=1170767 RepID=A0AAJ0H490_9PEZI|nr:hypothetical protein B0T15DRAFT_427861 [Chaetomium strumarium]